MNTLAISRFCRIWQNLPQRDDAVYGVPVQAQKTFQQMKTKIRRKESVPVTNDSVVKLIGFSIICWNLVPVPDIVGSYPLLSKEKKTSVSVPLMHRMHSAVCCVRSRRLVARHVRTTKEILQSR